MTVTAIEITGLSKKYSHKMKSIAGDYDFWALKDINLIVPKGEIFGIIGNNGAGKSTLLKILSQVTRQTAGDVTVKGKVNALLELGTGFEPELTGMDNLHIGAALKGLSRRDLMNRLPEILDFAGIGDAIHQPLRTYSSGMMVRLAFSLAVHLEPDVLLLDEILAVGDIQFQRKCFEKIQSFINCGTTVLLVSHDLRQIAFICNRVMLLNSGVIEDLGDPATVIDSYFKLKGQGIRSQDVSILHTDRSIQIWHGKTRLTHRFGLYLSVCSGGIWYDQQYVFWDQIHSQNKTLITRGHYLNLPISFRGELKEESSGTYLWEINLEIHDPVVLDKIQVNVMLSDQFHRFACGCISGTFPQAFAENLSSDWDRCWIGPPDTPVTCSGEFQSELIQITVKPFCKTGAMLAINSNEDFSARLIQYLKVYGTKELLPQKIQLFRGHLIVESAQPAAD